MKPVIIGILGTRVAPPSSTPFQRYERDVTNSAYIGAVERAGGVPVMLPVLEHLGEEAIKAQLSLCQGLIVPGGPDIDPTLYGEEASAFTGISNRHCDDHQLGLVRLAFLRGLPILGICRGNQLLNVAFGGSLWQDVSLSPRPSDAVGIAHSQYACCGQGCHGVSVVQGTQLASLFPNRNRLWVNSLHHQSVHKLGKGLRISATSDDGIIEAIEGTGSQWILGVQWHPEVLEEPENDMSILFSRLVVRAAVENPGGNAGNQ
ncbi:MAG: gamma-glutamyl-gamma-aminobutyrate hydrolase family protein [Sphaerochaetaceae bacterium]